MSELHRGVQGLVLKSRVRMVDGQSCAYKSRRFWGFGVDRMVGGANKLVRTSWRSINPKRIGDLACDSCSGARVCRLWCVVFLFQTS